MQARATPAAIIPEATQSLKLVADRLPKAMTNPTTRVAMVAATANKRIGDQ